MTALIQPALHFLDHLAAACMLIAALRAIAKAVWEGVRPEVVSLSEDLAAVMFGRLRRLLGLPPRHVQSDVASRDRARRGGASR